MSAMLALVALLAACGGGDPDEEVHYGSTRPCVYVPVTDSCVWKDDPDAQYP
jgi:hypothetical protein